MLQIAPVNPIGHLLAHLNTCQGRVNLGGTYHDKIDLAKTLWKSLSKSTDPNFGPIRDLLASLQGVTRRCSYCEDSLGYQIEHIYPKAIFPSVVFSWDNFLHACGSCNGAKLDQFSIYSSPGVVIKLSSRKPPGVEPNPKNSLLIDPRSENPLDFMTLDLRDTFHFVPIGKDDERAEYTITTLQLNLRSGLVESRRTALALYLSSFKEYDVAKSNNSTRAILAKIAKRIGYEMSHRTVWEEVKRQYLRATWLAEFHFLFTKHPEALAW